MMSTMLSVGIVDATSHSIRFLPSALHNKSAASRSVLWSSVVQLANTCIAQKDGIPADKGDKEMVPCAAA